jgi:hypothetical protein
MNWLKKLGKMVTGVGIALFSGFLCTAVIHGLTGNDELIFTVLPIASFIIWLILVIADIMEINLNPFETPKRRTIVFTIMVAVLWLGNVATVVFSGNYDLSFFAGCVIAPIIIVRNLLLIIDIKKLRLNFLQNPRNKEMFGIFLTMIIMISGAVQKIIIGIYDPALFVFLATMFIFLVFRLFKIIKQVKPDCS